MAGSNPLEARKSRGLTRLAAGDSDVNRFQAVTDLAGAEQGLTNAKEAYDLAVAEAAAVTAAVAEARASVTESLETTLDTVEAADAAIDLATGPVVDDSNAAAVDAGGAASHGPSFYSCMKLRDMHVP